MKRILGAICLLLTLPLCLAGCEYFVPKHEHSFEWVIDREPTATENGYKHLECGCGYKTEENTPIESIRNEDDNIPLDSKLIKALSDYLREYNMDMDIPVRSLGDQIASCHSGYNPLLVEGGEECYYVAVYSNEDSLHMDEYCNFEDYTWVRFNTSKEISEYWNNEAFLAAFQVNPAISCKNLKTGQTDYKMEHFFHIHPEFKDGFAIPIKKTTKILFIQLTNSDEKQLYCSLDSTIQGLYRIDCTEFEGEIFIYNQIGYQLGNGEFVEHDLEAEFGEYYDEIMNVMIVKEYTSESGTNRKSGFISILDFSDIVKN